MTTYDITRNMIPSRYNEDDRWTTRDGLGGHDPEWVELRMHCRYVRSRSIRFSVLYQGPAGEMRLEDHGPQVAGPVGALIPQPTVIASSPIARARMIDVKAGDVLIINGQRMVIVDDQPYDYPKLVTEVEAGLRAVVSLLRARRQDTQGADALLSDLIAAVRALAPELRAAFAVHER